MEYANSFSDNQTLISAKEVLRRVQRSKAWLYKQLANNTFPRPVKIGTLILPSNSGHAAK